jgi:hypothetical protein
MSAINEAGVRLLFGFYSPKIIFPNFIIIPYRITEKLL